MKTAGIVLIVAGALALAYQGFSYTKPERVAKIGPLEVTSEKREFVWIPPALGALALVAGVALMVIPKSRLT